MDTPPATSLTVAAVQATPLPGRIAHNAALAARLVGEAADAGARLVVLPELFLCAYHPPTLHADPAATDLPVTADGGIGDGRLDALRSVARERSVTVVVGASLRYADGRRTCSAVLVDRDGQAVAAYDKQLLWGPEENALFTPGTFGATLLVDGWRLGLGICYDGCFPEHGRAAADDGAHGYLVPSGYVVGSAHRRDVYYAARALDNTMYVVFANSVGGDPDWSFNGGAAVYGPEGQPVVRAADEGEQVVVATLDPVELARVRAAHTMLRDRRELGERRVISAR
ncbi:carbon-nitrogen hydrolase family protein [Asanoa siamensis]|uniref:Hydrolase n=1 Tax=Asanoa siamensis TaxID=926357 RepID=A0ABQ4D1W8_9ACTN|nr:carbon-nitrogen hydrolase family protein [Asanoa siamensis]GIF77535.1 hydrolase [Asanoa siamensis]